MKITRFVKIKNYRIFRNFSWPRDLMTFARYNLFYGWNGSGKSTLSSLFALLQRRETLSEGEITVEIDGSTNVLGSQFATAVVPQIRVFDRRFMRETLLAIRSANAKPILYVGKQSVEDARALETMRNELKSIDEALIVANADVVSKMKMVEKYATDQARTIKNHFSGSQLYVTFDKRRFTDGVQRIKCKTPSLQLLSEEEKEALEKQRFMQPMPDVKSDFRVNLGLMNLIGQVSDVLDQTVVSSVLDELASDSLLAQWVQEGLKLHSGERQTTKCRFCGNDFSEKKRHEYEAHFNDAYTRFQVSLQRIGKDIESRLTLLNVIFPAESSLYENLQSEYVAVVERAKASIASVSLHLTALLEVLEIKKTKPFERMKLKESLKERGLEISVIESIEAELADTVKAISAIVDKHNTQTREISKERDSAYNTLVRDCLLAAIPTYDELVMNVNSATGKRDGLQSQRNLLAQQIEGIEQRLIESRSPVEELNKELHSYLGRSELLFDVEGTGYQLLRSGHVADNLSEGECTAITFLYFLKTLSDKDFDKANGVIVIDDPVSSLDDNALFSAFAYMKEHVKDCGQLFVLTHNFSFFRQVKNWMFHMPGQKKKDINLQPCRFYALKCFVVDKLRAAGIGLLDPLLLQFESEYHFLFKTLYDITNSSVSEGLSCYYNVPNMARRLLESFLAYYVPDRQGELFHKMEGVEYDGAIKTRILRLLNTYSHAAVVAEPEHDPTVLLETQEVIKELLEMIKTLDEKHYNGMMSLLSTDATSTTATVMGEDDP